MKKFYSSHDKKKAYTSYQKLQSIKRKIIPVMKTVLFKLSMLVKTSFCDFVDLQEEAFLVS